MPNQSEFREIFDIAASPLAARFGSILGRHQPTCYLFRVDVMPPRKRIRREESFKGFEDPFREEMSSTDARSLVCLVGERGNAH